MNLPTRIIDAGKRKEISVYLSKSPGRQDVFACVYSRGNRPKDAAYISEKTGLTPMRVLQLATPMANEGYIVQSDKGRKVFSKQKDLVSSRDRILRQARNPNWLRKNSDTEAGKVSVTVRVKHANEIRVMHITADSIDNFRRIRNVTPAQVRDLSPTRLRENVFKYGLAHILGERGEFTDWGGEKNDLYTDMLTIGGKRYRAAIALKGIATRPPLTLKKLGKRADQIPKLFSSSAEVFLIQFEGQIAEEVIEQMETYAIRRSKETGKLIRFGIIGLEDSGRLRKAYPESFVGQVPKA